MKESSTKKIKEPERIVGTKQINIDYLEKMNEIAKTELDIDIKKTSAPHNPMVQGKQAKSKLSHESFV